MEGCNCHCRSKIISLLNNYACLQKFRFLCLLANVLEFSLFTNQVPGKFSGLMRLLSYTKFLNPFFTEFVEVSASKDRKTY